MFRAGGKKAFGATRCIGRFGGGSAAAWKPKIVAKRNLWAPNSSQAGEKQAFSDNTYREEWNINNSSSELVYERAIPEVATRLPLAEVVPKACRAMRILFLTNAHNGMSQALYLKLTALGHQVMLHVAQGEEDMLTAHDSFHPDAIVAPFLTKRVPERLWRNNATCPVLIVHPGVRGDRGVSSIDWALKKSLPEWGVTVLQADEEMDAGDVWKSNNFRVPASSTLTKSAFYNKLCVPAAVAGVQAALEKIQRGVPPRPLDYSHSDVTGQLEPNMKLANRAIDWTNASAEQAAQTVRFSDSSPGCPHTIGGTKYRLFGAYPEGGGALSGAAGEMSSRAAPGEPVGSICSNPRQQDIPYTADRIRQNFAPQLTV